MSLAIQCDRCGVAEARELRQAGLSVQTVTTLEPVGFQENEYDLCRVCALSLKRWLERPEPMPGNMEKVQANAAGGLSTPVKPYDYGASS